VKFLEPITRGKSSLGGGGVVPTEQPLWAIVVVFIAIGAVVVYVIWQYFKQRKR